MVRKSTEPEVYPVFCVIRKKRRTTHGAIRFSFLKKFASRKQKKKKKSTVSYLMPGAAYNAGEDGTRSIVTGESSFAHAGAVVNDQSCYFFVAHFRICFEIKVELTTYNINLKQNANLIYTKTTQSMKVRYLLIYPI